MSPPALVRQPDPAPCYSTWPHDAQLHPLREHEHRKRGKRDGRDGREPERSPPRRGPPSRGRHGLPAGAWSEAEFARRPPDAAHRASHSRGESHAALAIECRPEAVRGDKLLALPLATGTTGGRTTKQNTTTQLVLDKPARQKSEINQGARPGFVPPRSFVRRDRRNRAAERFRPCDTHALCAHTRGPISSCLCNRPLR